MMLYIYFYLELPGQVWHHRLSAHFFICIINFGTFSRSMFPIREIKELESMCRLEEMEEII